MEGYFSSANLIDMKISFEMVQLIKPGMSAMGVNRIVDKDLKFLSRSALESPKIE